MSRIHFRDVTLEDVVRRADTVLVVRLADPPSRTERVGVAGKTRQGQRCPDCARVLTRFEVLDALTPNAPPPGSVIEVESANAHAQLRLHSDYYQRGLSRSPIYERFEGAPLEPDRDVLAVLRGEGQHFAWVADVSCVALPERPRVERLLAQQPPAGALRRSTSRRLPRSARRRR